MAFVSPLSSPSRRFILHSGTPSRCSLPATISRGTIRVAKHPIVHACQNTSSPENNVFTVFKTVMPNETDYSVAMWHGNYLRWLEEARVNYLAFRNLPYEDLMHIHRTELPVRDLSIRYLHPARHGEQIRVTVRLAQPINKVRIVILSEFIRVKDDKLCATASVTIVPVDSVTGKVHRAWPAALKEALLGPN